MLSKTKLTKFKIIAQLAAKKAGQYLLKNFLQIHDHINFELKNHHEILTKFDTEAEKIILSEIKKNFPEHDILSEEAGMKNNISRDFLWIIDPLDGTTNFTLKSSFFGVSIALAYQGDIILGVIYIPFLKELFIAQKGGGAYLNSKKISVSDEPQINRSFLTFCHGAKDEKSIGRALKAYEHFKFKAIDMRQLGSAVAELGWVACARTEAIMIPGVMPWDVAAGALLVSEAGGKVTDWQGKAWSLKSRDILASNRKVHQQILKVLKKI